MRNRDHGLRTQAVGLNWRSPYQRGYSCRSDCICAIVEIVSDVSKLSLGLGRSWSERWDVRFLNRVGFGALTERSDRNF